jgi:hypothetical protein
MFKTTGLTRFSWYFVGLTLVSTAFNCYSGTILTQGHNLFPLLFFISLAFDGKLKIRNLRMCPLYIPLLLLFISYIFIGIFDERLTLLTGVYRAIYNYMITYGSLFLGWLSVYDEKIELSSLSKKLIIISTIFTLYGLLCFVTKTNPVVDALGMHNRFVFEKATVLFRSFLVSGFLTESGVYGLSCFLFFMLLWYLKSENIRLKTTTMILLFINLFLTGTRSIMIPAILGILLYMLIEMNIKEKIKYILIGSIIFIVVFSCLPNSIGLYISEIADAIVDVLLPGGSGGADLGGSSVDARDMQITVAFTKYLPKHPYFGHGFNYYLEEILVFNKGVNDEELLGMESYLCFLGVEYGWINIIAVILFYIWTIIYSLKKMSGNKRLGALVFSITITFIVYLIGAFMGDCWLYAMPVMGLLIGLIEYRKRLEIGNRFFIS